MHAIPRTLLYSHCRVGLASPASVTAIPVTARQCFLSTLDGETVKRKPSKVTSWQSRKKRMLQLLEEALQVDEIRRAWNQMLALFQQPLLIGVDLARCSSIRHGLPISFQNLPHETLDLSLLTNEAVGNLYYSSPDLVQWYYEFCARKQDLIVLLEQHFSAPNDIAGPELKDHLDLMLFHTPGLKLFPPWRQAAEYLEPGHPSEVMPDGELRVRTRLTTAQSGQIRDFRNALQPGQRGRPKNSPTQQQRAPREPNPTRTAQAAKVYQNFLDGIHWTGTVREMLPSLNLNDKKQREQGRQRYNSLKNLGERNAQRHTSW